MKDHSSCFFFPLTFCNWKQVSINYLDDREIYSVVSQLGILTCLGCVCVCVWGWGVGGGGGGRGGDVGDT